MKTIRLYSISSLFFVTVVALSNFSSHALERDEPFIGTFHGWKAIEVITEDDSRGGYNWEMPRKFDGAGAFIVNSNTIGIHVNHEIEDESSISEVLLNKGHVKQAISNMISNSGMGGVSFVTSARRAYDRFSKDGGSTWIEDEDELDPDETEFCKFCSSQEYIPNTFRKNRGFVDQLYITGEECDDGSLFVLDTRRRNLYELSGYTGSSSISGEGGGMPSDSFENAALIDTGETDHVALLLSADGGDEYMRIFIGQKGKNRDGSIGDNFLARNGLAYGEWFYLRADFPSTGDTFLGSFEKDDDNALEGEKLEDIDTNPNDPTKVVLSESDRGLFIFNFNLQFDSVGAFNAEGSGFTLTKIPSGDIDGMDNNEWSRSGQIFVNEDSDRGAVWITDEFGSSHTKIGETTVEGESSGIFDFSEFVDYGPGLIMITNNMGDPASMTILISPDAKQPESGPGIGNDISTDGPGTGGSAVSKPTDVDIYEAEDAILLQARIERRFSGFSGEGYVDMLGRLASIEWDIFDLKAGAYEIYVAYASGNDRPSHFYVDGDRVGTFNFEETPSWSDWTVESKLLPLPAGDHILKLTAAPNVGPNIDWLGLRYIQAIASPQYISDGSIRYEAEDSICDTCSVESFHAGFSGSGYIDFGAKFAYAQWAISILPDTETYEVIIRYASGPDRPADLVVDGAKRADLDFRGSGGWTSWQTETVMMSLTAGIHTFKIDCGEKSSGPNVDWIALHPGNR